MQRNNDLFNQLPNEVLFQILKYSNEKDIVKWSQVSFAFYNASKTAYLWQLKFKEAGCNTKLLQQMVDYITDYAKLYVCYIKVSSKNPATISELITFLIEDYLTYLQKTSLLLLGNDAFYKAGITAINNLFNIYAEEISGVPILDIISKLLKIDIEQSNKAYKIFKERYNPFSVQFTQQSYAGYYH